MWKRLKKFVDLFSASNKKKDVVSTEEEKEKEEIDPRLQAELDVMKILNSEKTRPLTGRKWYIILQIIGNSYQQ